MKNFYTILSLLIIVIAITPNAFAQEGDNDTGFYIALGFGQTDVETDEEFANIGFDDDDTGFNARLGYMYNNYIGFETSYYDFGEFGLSNSNAEIELEGVGFAFLGNLPVGLFDLYLKGGVMRLDAESSGSITIFGSTISTNSSEETTEPFAAFGVELDLGSFNIFGEYLRILDDDEVEVDLYTAGLKYEF